MQMIQSLLTIAVASFLWISAPLAAPAEPKLAIVLNSGEATVSLIDMQTRKVTKTFYVGKEPHHLMMTPDEKTLLVANAVGDDIALLNPLTGEITGRIPKIIDPYQIGYSPVRGFSKAMSIV